MSEEAPNYYQDLRHSAWQHGLPINEAMEIFLCLCAGRIENGKKLRAELEQLHEENRVLRSALNEIANMDMTRSDRPTPYHIAICALQKPHPLSAQYQKRIEAIEAVVEAARVLITKSKDANAGFDSLDLYQVEAALDSLIGEKEGL